jgi:flavodoxin
MVLVIIILTLVTVAVLAVAMLDLVSYTATGSQTFDPDGTPVGKALVVYDPGLSGQARQAALEMGQSLRAGGYAVTVAGVRSEAADNTSGYGIIIVGGPMYGGKTSSSIADYLEALQPQGQQRLGVYTTTGGTTYDEHALGILKDQVSSLTGPKPFADEPLVRLILTVGVEEDCAHLVDDLMA